MNWKNKLALATMAGAAALSASVPAAAQVGVTIGVNQPGVYGRVTIGDVPRPALVLPEPVIIAQPAHRYERQPIYLYVPPDHQRNWRRYCGRYNACNQPVYFVRDEWVRERYAREHQGWDRGRHRGWDRHDDRRDDRRDDHRGPPGRGHDHRDDDRRDGRR